MSAKCTSICVPLLLLALLAGSASFVSAREWKDTSGKFSVEAEFVRVAGDKVHLRKTNGVVIAVPLAKLDEESRRAVQESTATEATPAAAPAAGGDMGPDETIRSLAISLSKHQPRAVWEALPASYQKDVEDLIHAYAEKMDPDLWNGTFAILKKAMAVLKDKREFILGHPAVAEQLSQLGDVDSKIDDKTWDAVIGVVGVLVDSDLADLSKMQTLDVGKFLDTTGTNFMRQMSLASKVSSEDAFNQSLALLSGMSVKVLESDGDRATVQLTMGEETVDNTMVRVEGKWVPEEIATQWDAKMAEAKAGLAALEPDEIEANKPQVLGMMKLVENVLAGLAAAESQEDFNGVIGGLLQLFGGPGGGAEPSDGADPFGKPEGAAPKDDPFGK